MDFLDAENTKQKLLQNVFIDRKDAIEYLKRMNYEQGKSIQQLRFKKSGDDKIKKVGGGSNFTLVCAATMVLNYIYLLIIVNFNFILSI
jgi:hypothetical protein